MPAHQGGCGDVETSLGQALAEGVRGEIHRHESKPAGGGLDLAFPFLRNRVVDLEDTHLAGQRGSVSERVMARTQDDVLADPARDGMGETVLGAAAPAGHLRPGTGKYRVAA
jgi:hypothetical protein